MRGPLGADRLHALLDVALAVSGADEVEARATHTWGGLARFARSAIHQHVANDDTRLSVRVVTGARVGVASTNDATAAGAAAAAARALAAARLTPPDPSWPGLAGPAPLPAVGRRFDQATAAVSPEARAQVVATVLGGLERGQQAAGAVATAATETALSTTAGARLHALATRASVTTVVMGAQSSGHGEDAAVTLDDIDAAEVGRQAAATCAAAADPEDAAPGDYEVVLAPSAVTTLLEYLAFTAFSAKAYAEGRSALCGRLGQAIASPLVSIADDAVSPGALGMPFDSEGTPKSVVELISSGVATGLVHDRASAAAAGVPSTGHGLAAPNPWGPMPGHLVLAPGRSNVDQLVAAVDQGLFITRFWYTRTVNAKQTRVTGMTRDGTFRIQDGRRGPAVRSLRYNQSILEALATCDGVGDQLRTASDEWSDSRAPALRLRSFTVTSASDH